MQKQPERTKGNQCQNLRSQPVKPMLKSDPQQSSDQRNAQQNC